MPWDLIGGDPAPGSPGAIRLAGNALGEGGNLAHDAPTKLGSAGTRIDSKSWRGAGAAAFRADIAELPARLDEVGDSYRAASEGLQLFCGQLEDCQGRARAALAAADQADQDRQAAQRRLDGARLDAESMHDQLRSARAH